MITGINENVNNKCKQKQMIVKQRNEMSFKTTSAVALKFLSWQEKGQAWISLPPALFEGNVSET